MTQPAAYNRVASFATDQAAAPTTPLSGSSFDAEFNAIKTTLDQVLANLTLIQRDDTHLANSSVGRDQLDGTITLGFNTPIAWLTAHNFVANADTVFANAKFYKCLVSHTSGVFATDLAAGKWELIADFTTAIGAAVNIAFTPAQGIASTNVQAAIEEAVTDTVTRFDAPDYLVKTATAQLSNERVATDTATVAFDWATAGQVKANVPDSAITTIKINDGAILTAKIPDANVTFAKIQNISTGKLLGRTTASAGVIEQLDPGSSLSLGGGVLNANLATQGDATTGTDNIKVMTPLRTQQAVANRQVFHVRDQRANNAAAQSLTNNAFNQRTLQTVVTNTISGASLTPNQFTLPAGDYEIDATSSFYGSATALANTSWKLRLRNMTDTATTHVGASILSTLLNTEVDGGEVTLRGRFTLPGPRTFELQLWASIGSGNVFAGGPTASGEVEVYADVFIVKTG